MISNKRDMLTPCREVLLDKLIATWSATDLPAFYGTRKFVTCSQEHITGSRVIQSTPSLPFPEDTSIIILSSTPLSSKRFLPFMLPDQSVVHISVYIPRPPHPPWLYHAHLILLDWFYHPNNRFWTSHTRHQYLGHVIHLILSLTAINFWVTLQIVTSWRWFTLVPEKWVSGPHKSSNSGQQTWLRNGSVSPYCRQEPDLVAKAARDDVTKLTSNYY